MNKRWLIILGIVSVTINLLLTGGIVGHLMRGAHLTHSAIDLWKVVRFLDQEKRLELRPLLRQNISEGRALRHNLRKAQHKLTATLRDEPFSEVEVYKVFKNLQTHSEALQHHMHTQVIMVMKQLSQEDRAKVLQGLNREHRHKKHQGE